MRQPVLTAVVSVLLACPAAAADPKPNTLTQKEIADGWLLLFDGESTFGWTAEGDVAVKDGELRLSAGKKAGKVARGPLPMPCEVEYEFRSEGTLDVRFDEGGFGGGDPDQWIVRRVRCFLDGPELVLESQFVVNGMKRGGSETRRMAPEGPSHPVLSFFSSDRLPSAVRNVKYRPPGADPLLDGKTLKGWKVNAADPKRAASQFDVTDKGELRVTNGPGDLHTEKAFADFVLQFECKTNGDALNSGIFFRCVPDQYQNGYEAQIQNAFKDGDRTKPADFGTGAIYRRVPARKVVSNDKEWFAMTVIAHGAHISTWVNGYQVVDWTDDRKPDENPRKGLRTAAGHLSIQGHDPTTDILFRNIRVAEMKAAK
jgi:hypothetical protein